MKKITLLVAILSAYSYLYGQIPMGDPFWFTEGVLAGSDSSFKVYGDGSLRINDLDYIWPISDLAGQLTSDGSGNLTWAAASAVVSGLDSNRVLYGTSAGTIGQDAGLIYTNNGTTSELILTGADNAYLDLVSTQVSKIGIGVSGGFVTDMVSDGNVFYISDFTSTKFLLHYNHVNNRIGINTTTALQDIHMVADTLRLEGLDGTGTYLGIDANGDVTKTTVSGFGNVSKVGTPANNQIGIWTGDGTIEGDNSVTFDSATELFTIGDGTASPQFIANGNVFSGIDLQTAAGNSQFHNTNGSLTIENDAAGIQTGLSIDLTNVTATGKILKLKNIGAETLVIDKEGRIDLYGGAAIVNGNLLIGDAGSGDMELSTLTAGAGISITNGAGGIIVGNTGIITEVDGSVSNELQTFSNTSAATTHTVTLSSTGGSVQLAEGEDITLTTTGTALDGVVTIASAFNLDAGTYTPTATLVTNLDAVTLAGDFMYHRIGNIVTVWGKATIDATASGTTTFGLSLPIASNFTVAATDLYGFAGGIATATGKQFAPDADIANDRANFSAAINNTSAIVYPIWFSYIVK